MPDENKPSTLGDQIKSAQESLRTWPEWMRDAAKFSGQPAPNHQPPAEPNRSGKKD
jgi:hypothetical protein